VGGTAGRRGQQGPPRVPRRSMDRTAPDVRVARLVGRRTRLRGTAPAPFRPVGASVSRNIALSATEPAIEFAPPAGSLGCFAGSIRRWRLSRCTLHEQRAACSGGSGMRWSVRWTRRAAASFDLGVTPAGDRRSHGPAATRASRVRPSGPKPPPAPGLIGAFDITSWYGQSPSWDNSPHEEKRNS